MKNITILFIALLVCKLTFSQNAEIAKQWKDSVLNSNTYFEKVDIKTVSYLDLSKIISNRIKIKDDPWSTYIGVFGTKFRRIDFHLKANRNSEIETEYLVSGKSKLGQNIRELKGKMSLNSVLMKKDMLNVDTMFICLFDYQLSEPGDKDGDGVFEGIFSTIFYLKNGELNLFWSASGDYRDINNVFVGVWKRFNSDTERQCIFSFHPAGLYNKLPYCNNLYSYKDDFDDYAYIKEKFSHYGWEDYNPSDGHKSGWWK